VDDEPRELIAIEDLYEPEWVDWFRMIETYSGFATE